jgi:hypothetical protein
MLSLACTTWQLLLVFLNRCDGFEQAIDEAVERFWQ